MSDGLELAEQLPKGALGYHILVLHCQTKQASGISALEVLLAFSVAPGSLPTGGQQGLAMRFPGKLGYRSALFSDLRR
jgi:hypothetical protein